MRLALDAKENTMIRYSTVVTIDRTPAEVMAGLLDAQRYPEWTEMIDARFDGDGPIGVGSRGSFALPMRPLRGPYTMRIEALEPERRLDVQIDGPGLSWRSHTSLEPDGRGTRMTYAGDIRLRGWRRLLEPILAGEVAKGEALEAERFRDLLEAGGPAVGGVPVTAG